MEPKSRLAAEALTIGADDTVTDTTVTDTTVTVRSEDVEQDDGFSF
ncbi:hypothetical protein ACFVIM_08905 [Streptomyces sp. NPDC057638]